MRSCSLSSLRGLLLLLLADCFSSRAKIRSRHASSISNVAAAGSSSRFRAPPYLSGNMWSEKCVCVCVCACVCVFFLGCNSIAGKWPAGWHSNRWLLPARPPASYFLSRSQPDSCLRRMLEGGVLDLLVVLFTWRLESMRTNHTDRMSRV